MKPSGQRYWNRNSAQSVSLEKAFWNCGSDLGNLDIGDVLATRRSCSQTVNETRYPLWVPGTTS
jgi:hypothetical protein